MDIQEIFVVGAGTMGNGIAQVFAQNGHDVVLRDLSADILDRAKANITKSLGKLAEKGKLTAEERDASLGRIRFDTDLAACSRAGRGSVCLPSSSAIRRSPRAVC